MLTTTKKRGKINKEIELTIPQFAVIVICSSKKNLIIEEDRYNDNGNGNGGQIKYGIKKIFESPYSISSFGRYDIQRLVLKSLITKGLVIPYEIYNGSIHTEKPIRIENMKELRAQFATGTISQRCTIRYKIKKDIKVIPKITLPIEAASANG